MTPEQAIKILEQATAVLQLSRKDHEIILQALKVLTPKEKSE